MNCTNIQYRSNILSVNVVTKLFSAKTETVACTEPEALRGHCNKSTYTVVAGKHACKTMVYLI